MVTVSQNGIPNSSNSSNCNTLATKNKRNAAPIVLDNKKSVDKKFAQALKLHKTKIINFTQYLNPEMT